MPEEVPIVTRDQVTHAKPDPDLFLGRRAGSASTSRTPWWSATASGTCSPPGAPARWVGLLSGGYGTDELERAGAYRVYEDPAELLRHLDEVGVR